MLASSGRGLAWPGLTVFFPDRELALRGRVLAWPKHVIWPGQLPACPSRVQVTPMLGLPGRALDWPVPVLA